MGVVKQETRNEGRGQREWGYISLSEARVVRQLILARSRLDSAYPALREQQSLLGGTETAELYEPVFLTYVDLDRLIEQCGLSATQQKVVQALMAGYTVSDCSEVFDITQQSIVTHLLRAAEKIALQNEQNWEQVYSKKKI